MFSLHSQTNTKINMKTGFTDINKAMVELGSILSYQFDYETIKGEVCLDNNIFVVKELGHEYKEHQPLTLEEWLESFDCSVIGISEDLKFGKWVVNKSGMDFDNRYFIENNRLKNDDWIIHLKEKHWINWNDFIPAFLKCCEINKIQKINIKTFY